MPVISEEDETLPTADFAQLLDLPETAFTGLNEDVTGTVPDLGLSGHDDGLDAWGLPLNSHTAPGLDSAEPDYSRFDHFIPRFVWPEKPCDYCRSRKLNCYLQRGEQSCTPCLSLFRECSLTNSNTLEASNYIAKNTGTFLDTLHTVDEDLAKEQGMLTGIKLLRSKGGQSSGTATPVRDDDEPGSSKRNGIRFPRQAVKVLRDWLDAHADHPYPTEEEKTELEQRTDLKPNQIANWLANARRRRKVTEKTRPRVPMSPSLRPSTPAITIPIPTAPDKPWDELNPLERWKHSPPEHEPASITDIAHAVASSDVHDETSSPSSSIRRKKRSSNGSGFSNTRAPSTTSLDTSGKRSSSLSTTSAAFSHGSSQSHGSFGSFGSGLAGKRDRRRRKRAAPALHHNVSDQAKRIFQCTFCTDTFKSKYDWTRHEKSLHLSLEKWICGPRCMEVHDPSGKRDCVFCDAKDVSEDHADTAHYRRECEEKGIDARTFYRKDHLRQHLRLMHGCELKPSMETWKFTAVNVNSRCGFCAQRFTVWQERVDHLTAHFKAGARMAQWRGCRGLDPAVAAQVTNAMPPYLIGIESVSPYPFSATNRATWRQHLTSEPTGSVCDVSNLTAGELAGRHDGEVNGYGSRATCWEILTVKLGKYAREAAERGTVMTDEMLQHQARRILYDSDDTWNQTAADNPEWLDLFKKAHGLDLIPGNIGGQGTHVPEDLETYGDLGLRIPFAVQLQAYNARQSSDRQISNESNVAGSYLELLRRRREDYQRAYALLCERGLLHDEDYRCGHGDCLANMIDISDTSSADGAVSRYKRWCRHEVLASKSMQNLHADVHFLDDLGTMLSQGEGNLSTGQDLRMGTTRASAPNLKLSSQRAAGIHLSPGSNARNDAARARAQGLQSLAALEAPQAHEASCDCPEPLTTSQNQRNAFDAGGGCAGKKSYLQRHRYELPRDKAAMFATTTGAWQDSGMMPAPVPTATQPMLSMPSIEDSGTTSTGAMMEFLSDANLGELQLPFTHDAETSRIPLPTSNQTALDLALLDELIASSAAEQAQPTVFAPPTTSGGEVYLGAGVMEDVNFDEMDFDGVFEMPLDETIV